MRDMKTKMTPRFLDNTTRWMMESFIRIKDTESSVFPW